MKCDLSLIIVGENLHNDDDDGVISIVTEFI